MKKDGAKPQPGEQAESTGGASEEKVHKPRNPARPTGASQARLFEELLHRVRLARERRIRERLSADPDAEAFLSENEIVESLSELRSFYNECHEIAAASDSEIGERASIRVHFGVTERVVVGEVVVEDDEVVNAEFEECVQETAKALDLRPLDNVRNISMHMDFDFSRDPSDEAGHTH